jgi:phosphoglucosamine mutase
MMLPPPYLLWLSGLRPSVYKINLLKKMALMTRTYFGTDGIRGTVGQPPITPDFMLRLANAVGHQLKQDDPRPRVLIGKDTRISGYMLESALEAGFNSAGVDVILLGPLPTPAVAYLTRALRANLGVVISASHNPFDDNGIKFFSAAGTKLDDAWELAVEAKLAQEPVWVDSKSLGKAKRLDDAAGRYIEFCKSSFNAELTLKGQKIVVDAAHGAAYLIAPKLFAELGAEVVSIGCSPDGININSEVGATHPQALQRAVLESGAQFGVALDGDADRLIMVDGSGRLFNGDELLFLLAMDRLRSGEKITAVVGTLMTNQGVELALNKQGIKLHRAKVGDRYVLETLVENELVLGGEGSGHLLVLDKHSTGDGLISALQVVQSCLRAKSTLAALLADIQLLPQCLLNVRLSPNFNWREHQHFQAAVKATENELGRDGRVLIRPSGTEPVLRIMVEAIDLSTAETHAKALADVLA